jgi:hypothetical protein
VTFLCPLWVPNCKHFGVPMVFDENFTMNNPFEPHVHKPYVYEL